MSLDDKLRGILGKEGITYPPGAIEKIKQAFADEGYEKMPKAEDYRYEPGAVHSRVITSILKEGNYMTGQEWYDRFVQECKNLEPNHPSIFDPVYEAAKKASGIK
jgi:hypothetical protein